MSLEPLFRDLALWRELKWIRVLDEQFARFLHRLAPDEREEVLLAGALASHQLGRGHVCLPLARWLDDPLAFLGLPPEENEFARRSDPGLVQRKAPALASLEERLNNLDVNGLTRALEKSALVSIDGRGTSPLVLDRGNLYFRRTWKAETDIAYAVIERSGDVQPGPPAAELGAMIREIFEQPDNLLADGETRVDWQQVACAIASRGRFCIVSGGPGTGKTWTVVRIIALLQRLNLDQAADPLRIRLAAPTGKAAQRLSESIAAGWQSLEAQNNVVGMVPPEPASTLHRLLGSQRHTRHFRHDRSNPLPADVVIVDEASMIDQEIMQSLLDALAPSTRLILLGDKDQLSSVEAGAVFGDLCRDAGVVGYSEAHNDWLGQVLGVELERTGPGGLADQRVMLRDNYRSTDDINALAHAVNAGEVEPAIELLRSESSEELHWPAIAGDDEASLRQLLLHGDVQGGARQGFLGYLECIHKTRQALGQEPKPMQVDEWTDQCIKAYSRFQVLTAVRQGPWGVAGINHKVREWLRAVRPDGEPLIASDEWFHGRPVMITRNDYSTGLMNGDIGLCLEVPVWHKATASCEWQLRVVFPRGDDGFHYISPGRVTECQTAWAMTVHKAQGSEFEHAVLILPDRYSRVLTRELVYTGLTRARERFTLVAPDEGVFRRAIAQRTERSSALANRLSD